MHSVFTIVLFTGPVVQIKQALTRLKNECKQMEVQIGLVSWTSTELTTAQHVLRVLCHCVCVV